MLFSSKIIGWYQKNKRELPWRETRDPYKIWLSEVILQQTRVNQGLSYYLKFTENYPTVTDLANAPLEKVLKDWQGLGYYSRARNLHAAAQYVRDEHKGVFPADYKDIIKLKGVGKYTAAAIASIAFDLPYPVVDGNVMRVISRFYGVTEAINSPKGTREIEEAVAAVFDPADPAHFNQAIMEFGAMYCKPGIPDCPRCILYAECYAGKNGLAGELPVKKNKTRVKDRYFIFLCIERKGTTYLQQRGEKDIWARLYQFPLLEIPESMSVDERLEHIRSFIKSHKGKIESLELLDSHRHILTHQRLHADFFRIKVSDLTPAPDWKEVPLPKIHDYPVPVLVEKVVNKYY